MTRTVVFFDCESDALPNRSLGLDGFRYTECTCACALVLELPENGRIQSTQDIASSLDGGQQLACWRDVATDTSVPGGAPFEPLLAAFDSADLIVGYNCLAFDFPLLRKYYGRTSARFTQKKEKRHHSALRI